MGQHGGDGTTGRRGQGPAQRQGFTDTRGEALLFEAGQNGVVVPTSEFNLYRNSLQQVTSFNGAEFKGEGLSPMGGAALGEFLDAHGGGIDRKGFLALRLCASMEKSAIGVDGKIGIILGVAVGLVQNRGDIATGAEIVLRHLFSERLRCLDRKFDIVSDPTVRAWRFLSINYRPYQMSPWWTPRCVAFSPVPK